MHLHLYNTFLDLLTIQSNLKHTFMQHYAIHLSMVDLKSSINPKLHICGLRKKLEYMERSKTDKKPWEPRTFTLWVDSFNHLASQITQVCVEKHCSWLQLPEIKKTRGEGREITEKNVCYHKTKWK